MRRIGVSSPDAAFGARALEHVRYLVAQKDATHREIARGDALGDGHHVRLHTPMPRAGPVAGAAKASDYLVRDQQDTVAVADVAHVAHERRIRHDHPARAL